MSLTFPYPLAFLSDALCTRDDVLLTLRRNDEISGSGDGRYWTAQLARPIWSATVNISYQHRARAREIDAKIRALNGSANAFLWADPFYRTSVDPGSSATISAIGADRTTIALTGLPAGYVINPGDRLSIAWGTDRYYLAEVAETVAASGSGLTGQFGVMPYLPLSISTGAAVEMAKPVVKMIIPPDGYTPFSSRPGRFSQGASIQMLQKV